MSWTEIMIAIKKGIVASAESVANIVSGATAAGNADKLGGNDSSYYATKASVTNITNGTTKVGNADKLDGNDSTYFATAASVTNIVNGTTKVGNADKLGGLMAKEFVSNENLLINADFKNPINSSGKTSWSGSTFLDKWSAYMQDTDKFSIELTGNGIILTKGNGGFADIYATLTCALENGRKYTLSALINGTVYVITFAYNGGNYSQIGDNIFLIASSSQFGLRFNVTQSYTIEWLKLEVGNVATAFIPQNLVLEKIKCGISKSVIVSATAPADTTAVWIVPN